MLAALVSKRASETGPPAPLLTGTTLSPPYHSPGEGLGLSPAPGAEEPAQGPGPPPRCVVRAVAQALTAQGPWVWFNAPLSASTFSRGTGSADQAAALRRSLSWLLMAERKGRRGRRGREAAAEAPGVLPRARHPSRHSPPWATVPYAVPLRLWQTPTRTELLRGRNLA